MTKKNQHNYYKPELYKKRWGKEGLAIMPTCEAELTAYVACDKQAKHTTLDDLKNLLWETAKSLACTHVFEKDYKRQGEGLERSKVEQQFRLRAYELAVPSGIGQG